jgi:hypothetical protein
MSEFFESEDYDLQTFTGSRSNLAHFKRKPELQQYEYEVSYINTNSDANWLNFPKRSRNVQTHLESTSLTSGRHENAPIFSANIQHNNLRYLFGTNYSAQDKIKSDTILNEHCDNIQRHTETQTVFKIFKPNVKVGQIIHNAPFECLPFREPNLNASLTSMSVGADRRKLVLSDYYSLQRTTTTSNISTVDSSNQMDVEPTQQDSNCRSCLKLFGLNSNSIPKVCYFCLKSYCEVSCIAKCDSCMEQFCRNCSTPNHFTQHGNMICIDCCNRVL